MTNLNGPGSDPNPVGNLTHMRQVTYMMDMERGPGSSPIAGQQAVGANQIVRGSGIIDKSFQGIKIDQFGIHLYGETVTRAIFIRESDGTLSATLTRTNTEVDSGSTGATGTILLTTTDHEVFIDSNGHEVRVGGDLYPSTDNARNLGEDSTPRRWKEVHTNKITFSNGTSITTFQSSPNIVVMTVGATILEGELVRIHTDGKVYPATRALQTKIIGLATENISGGSTLITLFGFFVGGIAGASITSGDLLRVDPSDARIVGGATWGSGDVVGIAINGGISNGDNIAYMAVRA